MKLQTIQAYHVRGCEYAEIAPRQRGLTILGGANAAGKSSLLDAIAMAIGGKRLFPKHPIQEGQDEAEIIIQLDGGTTALPWPCKVHRTISRTSDGKSYTTEVKIIAEDGHEAPTPQTLLDMLLTPRKLEMDPVAFIGEKPVVQAGIVQRLVGLDFTELDAAKEKMFEERKALNRQVRDLEGEIREMPVYDGIPREKIEVSDEVSELRAVEGHNQQVRRIKEEIDRVGQERAIVEHKINALGPDMEAAEKTIRAEIKERMKALEAEIERRLKDIDTFHKKLASELADKHAALTGDIEQLRSIKMARGTEEVDPEPIRERIERAAETNKKIDHVNARLAVMEKKNRMAREAKALTTELEAIDRDKKKRMEEANWPIVGMGFDASGGLIFNGRVLSDLSSSEQLKVAVAIAASLNPDFRYVIIRDGSLLDEERRAQLEDIANELDAQVLLELVTEGNGCHYIFEQGRAKKCQD